MSKLEARSDGNQSNLKEERFTGRLKEEIAVVLSIYGKSGGASEKKKHACATRPGTRNLCKENAAPPERMLTVPNSTLCARRSPRAPPALPYGWDPGGHNSARRAFESRSTACPLLAMLLATCRKIKRLISRKLKEIGRRNKGSYVAKANDEALLSPTLRESPVLSACAC